MTKKERSITGCTTCRIRRVKCDETKPNCHRCTSTGRTCDGFINAAIPRKPQTTSRSRTSSPHPTKRLVLKSKENSPLRASLSPGLTDTRLSTAYSTSSEARLLDYYLQCTLPSTISIFQSSFWTSLVLQLSHSEPSIRHGLLAVTALHEHYEQHESRNSLDRVGKEYAFRHYGQALAASKDLVVSGGADTGLAIAHELEKILAVTVLFTSYENLSGNFPAAAVHLRSGQRILKMQREAQRMRPYLLAEGSPQPAEQIDGDLDGVEQLLMRFDLHAMTFSSSEAQYQLPPTSFLPPVIPEAPFTTLTAARDFLITTLHFFLWANRYVVESSASSTTDHHHTDTLKGSYSTSQNRQQVQSILTAWPRLFSHILHTRPSEPGTKVLQVYHLVLRVVFGFSFTSDERAWDPFILQFKQIVEITSSLISSNVDESTITTASPSRMNISFDPQLIFPLFLTAIRCRDPLIRRSAISLLDSTPSRREAAWESKGAARVAEAVVEMEEGDGLGRRVKEVMPKIDVEARSVDLRVLFEDGEMGRGLVRY